MDINKLDLLGAALAVCIISFCILIFTARLLSLPKVEYWLGIFLLLTTIPIMYLLFRAESINRSPIYYIQIGAILLFFVVELLLDYIFKIEFRQTKWLAIPYVMIFFAATGGMIGIASLAGRGWMISTSVLFLIMAFLAFYQRAKTGM